MEKRNRLYEVSLLGTNVPHNPFEGHSKKVFVIAKTKSAARQKIVSYIEEADDDFMPISCRFRIVEVKEYDFYFPPIIDKNLDFLMLYEKYIDLKQIEKEYKQLKKEYQQLKKEFKEIIKNGNTRTNKTDIPLSNDRRKWL